MFWKYIYIIFHDASCLIECRNRNNEWIYKFIIGQICWIYKIHANRKIRCCTDTCFIGFHGQFCFCHNFCKGNSCSFKLIGSCDGIQINIHVLIFFMHPVFTINDIGNLVDTKCYTINGQAIVKRLCKLQSNAAVSLFTDFFRDILQYGWFLSV